MTAAVPFINVTYIFRTFGVSLNVFDRAKASREASNKKQIAAATSNLRGY